jgi:predicted esterase
MRREYVMIRAQICSIVIFLLMASPVIAVGQEPGSRSSSIAHVETFWQEVSALVPVQVYVPSHPAPDEPRTLILALHGFGATAEGWARIGRQLADKGFIVAVPEAAHSFLDEDGNLGFDWSLYHVGNADLDKRAYWVLIASYMPALVKSLQERYEFDEAFLLGHSQGAIAAMLTGLYQNQSFSGVITFGLGAYSPAWFDDARLAAALQSGSHLSILLLHGKQDERVPLAVSEEARQHLTNHGYSVTLRTFQGGHTVAPQELEYVAQWIRGIEQGR